MKYNKLSNALAGEYLIEVRNLFGRIKPNDAHAGRTL